MGQGDPRVGDVDLKELVSGKSGYQSDAPAGAALMAQAMSRGEVSVRYKAMQAVKDWDRTRLGYRAVKRAFDIVFSGCVLAVIAVPSLVLAAAIRLESECNPFYSQIRVGQTHRDGSLSSFRMWKFRCFYGVRLLDEGFGADVASETLVVVASWLDATGANAGVACEHGSLVTARFVTPAGGAFGAGGVVDAVGTTATHVVVEPAGATAPAGKTDTPSGEVPGGGVNLAPAPETGKGPAVKPAVVTTNTTVTKTTVSKPSKPKASASGVSSTLPKTADSNWVAMCTVLFLLGTALLATAHRC